MEEKHEGDEGNVFVFLYLDSLVWRVKFLSQLAKRVWNQNVLTSLDSRHFIFNVFMF
jgi:Na+-transporting methylmalonyl-CoA/oxaloacetate decarboxylase gamma subunit